MTTLRYLDRELEICGTENVLDCLLRHGVAVASSCRSGVCQSCLVQGAAAPPGVAQKGLKVALTQRHFFMSCQCPASDSPAIVQSDQLPRFSSQVTKVTQLSSNIFRVVIQRPVGLHFESGQFIQLVRPADGLTRPYSIASRAQDEFIELHVARLIDGQMSNHLTEGALVTLQVAGPLGECVYAGNADEPLLLVGTGTGLSPLLGVLRTALDKNHRAPIVLLHGATTRENLYMHAELTQLQKLHPQFRYFGSVWSPAAASAASLGPSESTARNVETDPLRIDIAQLTRQTLPRLNGHRVYLCGHPDLVRQLKKQCFLAGASMSMIHSDPFVSAPPAP